ncbi:MAG: ArnT family glycosyltransferase [Pyrinomonadaceae bacterium]
MTKQQSENRNSQSAIVWLVLAALTVFTYFFGLSIPLVGPDEPRYAQVAREMFERGDWVTPTLGGHTWFEKPALLYWLEIASYHVFGVNEFAARFGSALFGLCTVICLWLIGRRVAGSGRDGVAPFSNWLALAAATSIGMIVFSRGASFDIILTFPITAALTAFFYFDRGGKMPGTHGSTLPLALFYFFTGVAVIAKGLVGIVFPYAIVAFYFVLGRRMPSRRLILSFVWGTLLAAAVAGIWYVPVYLANGWSFVDEFIIQHHFQRYLTNKYFHPQPFYFFLWVLPLMTIPWLPFFFVGAWRAGKALFNCLMRRGAAARPEPLLTFAAAWLLVPLVFFSFSGSKLPGYIMPAVPPAIIVAAFAIERFVGSSLRRAAMVQGAAAATLVTVVALLIFVVPLFADGDSVKRMIAEADARGYRDSRVVCMHHLVHNAEFYAAGRMVRNEDGDLAKLLGPGEVLRETRRGQGRTVLVLVPKEYERTLTGAPYLTAEKIAENSETSLVAVRENGGR